MNKLKLIIVTTFLLFTTSVFAQWQGSRTPGEPYQIKTDDNLAELTTIANGI